MKLLHLSLLLCLCVIIVRAAIEPTYGESSQTTYNSRGNTVTFPPSGLNEEQLPYFAEDLNFNAIDGKILIGAADKLYVLDKDLSKENEYFWNSSRDCTQPDKRLCRNHIRIYQRPPNSDASNSLFVCGTQSGIQPQCRMLNVSGSRLIELGQPNPTRLISAHPDFPGFGDFRKESSLDNVYFAANFKSTDSMSFDISYQQVNISDAGDSVMTSRLYGWQEGDPFWLDSPVVFVDFQRIDYATLPGQSEELLQFYFVFLRENEPNEMNVITRVLRLCRNDAGVNRTANPMYTVPSDANSQVFTSYMKTRIFCEREMPPGTQFVGAQDFKYDEMWSVAFNNLTGGRFHENTPYARILYGAFSGPRIGPVGTAICAYRADMGDPSSSEGLTGGIFDVFRDDVINPRRNEEHENDYLMCNPGGRSEDGSQRTNAVQDVRQIGENPLIIFEDFYVTQMVVDQVCVVRRDNPSACFNQDVLFLGTSNGRVLKVAFATGNRTSSIIPISPVVAEEIQLDDMNSVKEMKIENVGYSKQLYVVTASRIYRLPLERCSRHQNNITSCLGSRDPYCVWDSNQTRCVASSLSAVRDLQGTVPVYQRQNIHTGVVHAPLPNVGFEESSYTVMEGGRLTVTVVSDRPVEDGVVQLDIRDLTAKVGVNVFSSANPINVSLREPPFRRMFEIEARKDGKFNATLGDLQFQLSLRNTMMGAVYFTQQNTTVTIDDIDGTLIRIGLSNLGSGCVTWRPANSAKVSQHLIAGIATAIGGGDPESYITNPTFNCANVDDKYITFTAGLLATTMPSQSVSELLQLVEEWVRKEPKIDDFPNIVVDATCSVRISTLNSTCEPRVAVGAITSGTASTASFNGLLAGLIIALAIIVCLATAVVVLLLILLKSKKNTSCPPSENAKVKPEGDHFYCSVEESTEVPQPLTQSSGSRGLADRRGSKDLHLDMPEYKPHLVGDTNPRSSDPLLARKFFTDSDEADPSSFGLNSSTVEHNGAAENYGSSNGIQMHTTVEINEKVDLSIETSGQNISEQHV